MKVYRFSLETVMRIRALEERLVRERLMVAQRDLRLAQVVYRQAKDSLEALAAPTGQTTMDTICWVGDQATRLSEEVRVRGEELVVAASIHGEVSHQWHVTRKRLGTLERLDSEGRTRWKREIQRQAVAELDDMANARHGFIGARS